MQKAGHHVRVLVGGEGPVVERLKENGVPYLVIKHLVHPISFLKDMAALVEIYVVLKRNRPDLVSTHSSKAGFLGRVAARLLGIKAVHTSHGWFFGDKPETLRERVYLYMERCAARFGCCLIAVSGADREKAYNNRLASNKNIKLILNGIDQNNNLSLASPQVEPPQLVMVARFEEPKDHITVLEALSGLSEIDWSLVFVGGGSMVDACKNMVSNVDLEKRVWFAGEIENSNKVLSESQVFILSSKREGLPLSILEAMRAGLPVVASNVGGVAEAVIPGKTGFLFEQGNSAELKNILNLLITDAGLREEMGRRGRAYYQKQFTLKRMAEETLAFYQDIINESM